MKRRFSKKEVQRACHKGEGEQLERISVGDWIVDGKCDFHDIILQAKDTDRFYCYSEFRSGSYYTGYTYSWEWEKDVIELEEVCRVEKVIEVWEAV